MVVSLLNEKGLLLGHVVFCYIQSALPETINLITKEAPGISGLKFDYNQIKICWDTLFFVISALPETINRITKEAPGHLV